MKNLLLIILIILLNFTFAFGQDFKFPTDSDYPQLKKYGQKISAYKFKYINGEFALIGADKTESMRNTGETETRSYNFLTNKMSVTTGNYDEKVKKKVKWKTYKIYKLKTFRTFPKPFDWEIEQDYFI